MEGRWRSAAARQAQWSVQRQCARGDVACLSGPAVDMRTGAWAGGYGVQIRTRVTGQAKKRLRGVGTLARRSVGSLWVWGWSRCRDWNSQALASLPHAEKHCWCSSPLPNDRTDYVRGRVRTRDAAWYHLSFMSDEWLMNDANVWTFGLAVMKQLLSGCFGTAVSEAPAFVARLASGSSLHPDLRGLSLPSSPSFTPNAPTVLCGGKSEPNLNIPLNVSLNSSLSSNYHTTFSSSTGRSTFHCTPSYYHTDWNSHWRDSRGDFVQSVCGFFSRLRYNPKLSVPQSPRVPHLHVLLVLVERRVHHLLRERGGHSPLRLWTHVSLLHLRP